MKKDSNLGKIKKVELRKAWNHEAADFTNWLAEEENLQLLSDEVGIDINLIQMEANVGKFNVDILAEEEHTGNKIIIENQLEATDHDHLGKIITYASGFDARMIVWVVKEAREEHRQAIDWLNEHTDTELAFLLIRVELWQIDESRFAPKFETISKPNDWAKTVKQSVSGSKITDTQVQQHEFWEQFEAYARNHDTSVRLRRPSDRPWWARIDIGSRHADVWLDFPKKGMRTELYITDNKKVYYFLEQQKGEIEKALGYPLEWGVMESSPNQKAIGIRVVSAGRIDNTDEWETYFEWLQKTGEQFKDVFGALLKKYK